ncbi:SGNH/GDSL hydrolase family protein [Phenylobacterium deserti]|uniref:SGNH/GDSL hydrolase family protein n=1 Tax=Phenylobacterium deserti TaxID=1914756 RepID=UPI001F0CA465|nr:SGNH/GDSL hydrolase family protein [Phenylobacterium deserti]
MVGNIAGLVAGLLATAAVAAEPLPVNIGGRTTPLPGGAHEFGWPGVYFESRFKGPEVSVAAETQGEHLAVIIDGQERAIVREPGPTRLTFSDLGPGEHTIRLQKTTEDRNSRARFLGFFPGKATSPLPAAPLSRQIEFIGDSYTVGYANTSGSRTCSQTEIHDTTDTRKAFGPLFAEKLDADYGVEAWSGFGVVRNYNGVSPELSALKVYPRVIPADSMGQAPNSPDWKPQLIVIGLGTNDFSTPLHTGERWSDQKELRADYRAQYVAFVQELAKRQPQARFILMANADWRGEVEDVASQVSRRLPGRVRVLGFSGLELTACDYHPSLNDHAALAEQLVMTAGLFGPELWAR